jgi:hypothetical protein
VAALYAGCSDVCSAVHQDNQAFCGQNPYFPDVNETLNVCLARITMGGFMPKSISSTVTLEKNMSKMHNAVLPVALLLSALALSACATKKEEAVVEPAPVAAPAEQPAAVEPAPAVAAEQPAPAPVASTAEVAPKPVVKKAKKKAKAKAKVTPPPAAPVEVAPAPAPVVQQAAPAPVAQPEPTPAPVATPAPKPATKGFLEQYWLWLVGIVIAILAIVFMMKKKD